MENLNYKLIMRVKQLNMKVVQFLSWVCKTSHGMGYICKIEGNMTQALYLSILQDGVMKTIEWFCSCVIFHHDNDPNRIAKLINAKF
jgi:hypothetical protein